MSAPRTSSFQGEGMNLVATTTEAARSGSAASRAPRIRSLSPRAYTSAVSNNVTPASTEASHASLMESRVRPGSYPPIPHVERSPQAQVPTPSGGIDTSEPARV
jgi:hypothetical protein